MKVTRVKLENFKRFDKLEFEVRNQLTDQTANTFLVLGDNGSGKTTALQAIAFCLSKAAGITKSAEDFRWIGWVPGRYERWGRPIVEIDVTFTPSELSTTREAARRWFDSQNGRLEGREFVDPGDAAKVTLRMEGERLLGSQAEIYQLRGRAYAAQLLKTDPSARELFDHLPGVFWFDQLRNLASHPGRRLRFGRG